MKKVVFVILHYLTGNDTLECVSSIERNLLLNKDYAIVIVDNASYNNSLEEIHKRLDCKKHVDILELKENLGFARGNNCGISFAREKYNPDFIICMNNDVVILQKDIISIIDNKYRKYKFAVLGPMIFTSDGTCDSNPGVSSIMSESKLKKTITKLKICYVLSLMRCFFIYNIGKFFKQSISPKVNKDFLTDCVNVQLHGSCLVFSRKYFQEYRGFFSNTFLYMEEEILFWRLRKRGLNTLYTPDMRIFHKEDSASKELWCSGREMRHFKIKNALTSARAFLKLIERNK